MTVDRCIAAIANALQASQAATASVRFTADERGRRAICLLMTQTRHQNKQSGSGSCRLHDGPFEFSVQCGVYFTRVPL